jgi:hypothetical protein
MRQIDGDDVPHHDQGYLRVPDEARPDDAVAGVETRGAEDVPTPSQRVGDQGDYHLPLDEQIRVVVGHLVGDGDGYEGERVGGREPPETYFAIPTENSAELHEAEVDTEEQ